MSNKREILYRGICDDSTNPFFGQFIYGDLIEFIDLGSYIRISSIKKYCIKVKEDTVGQYIGKSDIKGNKIFEGDYDHRKDVVGWCEKRNGWSLFTYNTKKNQLLDCHCHYCEGHYDLSDCLDTIHIVGTIHT